MSRLDYKFKEIPFDPVLMDSLFSAPPFDDGEEERRKQARDDYIREKMRQVRKAMDACLTGRQSDCLTRYYLKGYSQRWIGERLRIHQTTVSQHIRYALRKLRLAFLLEQSRAGA